MVQNSKSEDRGARTAPFGLSLSLAVFDRAARLAEEMFISAGASVILVNGGEIWRSAYVQELPTEDPVTEQVLADGLPLWIEDGRLHPDFADHPLVTGPPFLRFTAAAPISLADGTRPGVLSVSGTKPQPYDARKVARLADLADFVADEWARALVVRAYEQSIRERDAALQRSERSEERLNLALALSDLHVFELDYGRRELIKAGAEETFFPQPLTYEDLFRDIYSTVDSRDRAHVVAAWSAHRETGVPIGQNTAYTALTARRYGPRARSPSSRTPTVGRSGSSARSRTSRRERLPSTRLHRLRSTPRRPVSPRARSWRA